jgi:hypothetical protein
MSDIYLQITETPTVVTLSAPVISGALSSTVTVANVVSVNVVTMPAITVQASAPSVTTVAGTVTIGKLPAISGTVTANIGNAGRYDNGGDSLRMDLTAVRGQDAALFLREGGGNVPISGAVTANAGSGFPAVIYSGILQYIDTEGSIPVSIDPLPAGTNRIGVVTVGNSVTISSLPNVKIQGFNAGGAGQYIDIGVTEQGAVPVVLDSALPPGTAQIGSVTANNQNLTTGSGSVSGTSAVGTDVLASTDVSGFAEMMIQFTGSFPTSANAQFQVSNDNSTFVSQAALQVGFTSPQATISALGMYKISLGGARYIRLRVTVQGSANNYNYSYTLNPRTSFNSTQPVHVSSLVSLPSGTNRIGVVTIGAGTVTIGAGTEQIGSVTASLAISSSVITSGSFTSLSSATLVPANTARKMATVYNLGAGQLFINAGASATTLGGGFMVVLSGGDFYECDYTTTTLSAIFATAGTASWFSH